VELINLFDEPFWSWLGPLAPFLEDPGVVGLIADGAERLYLERQTGREAVAGELAAGSLERLAERLAAEAGASSDQTFLRLSLASGESVVLIRPPLSAARIHLTILRPSGRSTTLAQLVDADVVPHIASRLLAAAVVGRRGILVASAAGFQGTLLLEGLCEQIAPEERVVVIEATLPLRPQHPRSINLHAATSAGNLAEPFQAAAALRPDRIVTGGLEVATARWFLELAPQLPGSMAAVSAVDARTALLALESSAVAAGLPQEAARTLCPAAFSLVIVAGRLPDGRSTVVQVSELVAGPAGGQLRDLFITTQAADDQATVPVLVPTGLVPRFLPALAPFGVVLPPSFFAAQAHGLPDPPGVYDGAEERESQPVPQAVQQKAVLAPVASWDELPASGSGEVAAELQAPPFGFEPPDPHRATTLPPALPAEELTESDDPGWELEVMSRRTSTQAGADSPDNESAFAAMLRAKRVASEPRHTPRPPVAHPQFNGMLLEPPPGPMSAEAERELLHSGASGPSGDPDPEKE